MSLSAATTQILCFLYQNSENLMFIIIDFTVFTYFQYEKNLKNLKKNIIFCISCQNLDNKSLVYQTILGWPELEEFISYHFWPFVFWGKNMIDSFEHLFFSGFWYMILKIRVIGVAGHMVETLSFELWFLEINMREEKCLVLGFVARSHPLSFRTYIWIVIGSGHVPILKLKFKWPSSAQLEISPVSFDCPRLG